MARLKSEIPNHPLAEVFGHKTTDMSAQAKRHRDKALCPFHNNSERCTKDKADAPLGVCSIYFNDEAVTICPVRFREKWKIAEDAAGFFFGSDKECAALKEVRLKERSGKSAGNIDLVIAKHTKDGKVRDFGAVEVQAVYVSGNIRNPFEYYMEEPGKRGAMDWTAEKHYPRPDFLSSSRKRLYPQLLYKGQILRAWGKKLAVIVDRPFFKTLPPMKRVEESKANVCWFVYDLKESSKSELRELILVEKVPTTWDEVFRTVTSPDIGDVKDFIDVLERKLAAIFQQKIRSPELSIHDWISP